MGVKDNDALEYSRKLKKHKKEVQAWIDKSHEEKIQAVVSLIKGGDNGII